MSKSKKVQGNRNFSQKIREFPVRLEDFRVFNYSSQVNESSLTEFVDELQKSLSSEESLILEIIPIPKNS